MSEPTPSLFPPPTFGERFLADYAGAIVADPKVAVAELIANAHDAGATRVRVTWPATAGEPFEVVDNGTGMTREQFLERWSCLSYDRLRSQGEQAEFPADVPKPGTRPVFGRNGKGRLAPFCFADGYEVQTVRGGYATTATVTLAHSAERPFLVDVTSHAPATGHGTTIRWTADRVGVREETLVDLIGSVFLLDPQFSIEMNGREIDLGSLDGVACEEVRVPKFGTVKVFLIDTRDTKRHNRPGVAWRVNTRLVGEPGWQEFDSSGHYPNGRPEDSRRFCFVVEADLLKDLVKPDWKGLYDAEKSLVTRKAVYDHVASTIRLLTADSVAKRKRTAIRAARGEIEGLPRLSVATIGRFVSELQEQCPRLSQREVNTTVAILAKLEQSRTGYQLLDQLGACDPDELDKWTAIMKSWSADHAEKVLSELERRLGLISRLERLMGDRKTDEVHELLPLFVNGLWMFGPEYETVEFRANRTLATVLRDILGGTTARTPIDRPDVVAVPSGSIIPFSLTGYDESGEAGTIAKLLIVELKKGGFKVGQSEIDQAKGYVRHLKKGGHVRPSTAITAYVLGWELGDDAEDERVGNTEPLARIMPRTYGEIVRRAHERTFNLAQKIRESEELPPLDPEIASEIVGKPSLV